MSDDIDRLLHQLTHAQHRAEATHQLAALVPQSLERLRLVMVGEWTDAFGILRRHDSQLRTNAVIAIRLAGKSAQSLLPSLRSVLLDNDTGAPTKTEVVAAMDGLDLSADDTAAVADLLSDTHFAFDVAFEAARLLARRGRSAHKQGWLHAGERGRAVLKQMTGA